MTTIALLLITGLGLGALYFLIAAGLSLIWGLMRVLNFAHGAFFTVAAYAGWSMSQMLPGSPPELRWALAVIAAVVVGGVFAALTEVLLIRPLYARHVGQVLVTVGLALATVSLVQGGFGSDPQQFQLPVWMTNTTSIAGAGIPNTRLLVIAFAAVVLALLLFFLQRTRFGLIVRAGVENRDMVQALGIDVQRAFTLVFTIGGMAAGLAGILAATYYGTVDPVRGTSMLIFAFIVVIIGGLGSVTGSAVAAVVVGVLQQFLNFYAAAGVGDFSVVLLLAVVLLVRPGGFSGVVDVTRSVRIGIGVALLVLAVLPFVGVTIPWVFDGALNAPGTLNLLGMCFVFGALAITYDIVFGYVGLLSFGHALYFATGVYVTAIALARWHWSLPAALALTVVVSLVLPLVLGAICLRMRDIPFAMVTLAFAQAGSILVMQNPFGLTGGEEGLALGGDVLPSLLVGVVNTRYVYWVAFALIIVVYVVAWRAVNSPPGRVWQAIRENERRVGVMGLNPYLYKLGAFVLSAFLASLCGVVYLLLQGGANPQVTTADFTLALLVMVVLGGVGTLWGAVLGGVVYEYLDFRLVALSNAPAVQSLPALLRVPLSEPLFLLGVLFIVLVLFVPGGLGGALRRRLPQRA